MEHDELQTTNTVAAPLLSTVTVKLPTFWALNPATWFHQAEAQFSLRNITTSETYFHVVSVLDGETSVQVAPFLLNTCIPISYVELKELLLDTYRLWDDEQAHSFSNITDLRDRKPSEVMDQMLLLHGQKPPTFCSGTPLRNCYLLLYATPSWHFPPPILVPGPAKRTA